MAEDPSLNPRPSGENRRRQGREAPQGPRLFTLAEADALIPFLEKALADLAAFRKDLRVLRRDIEVLNLISASAGGVSNPDSAELRGKRRRFRHLVAEIDRLNAAIEESGCLVKQPDHGLVDFFHLKDGRLVFLCWKVGEDRIRAWHPLSGGYSGRQLLEPDGV